MNLLNGPRCDILEAEGLPIKTEWAFDFLADKGKSYLPWRKPTGTLL